MLTKEYALSLTCVSYAHIHTRTHTQIQVDTTIGTQFIVLYNSEDISTNLTSVNDTFMSPNMQAEITRPSESSIQASFSSGIGLTVTVNAGIPSIVVTAPEAIQSETVGLLGNFNGNQTDDFVYFNGTVLSDGASDRDIHSFGRSCECVYCTWTNYKYMYIKVNLHCTVYSR